MPMDYKQYQEEVTADIAEVLANARCQPILFVGSGFTKRYAGGPNWEELLTSLAKNCPLIDKEFAYYKQTYGEKSPPKCRIRPSPAGGSPPSSGAPPGLLKIRTSSDAGQTGMKLIAALLALLACATYAAEKFDVQDVRKDFVNGCVMRGIRGGQDAERATKFCSCSFDVLATNLTVAEYLEVDRTGKAGQKPENLPAMQRVFPKLAVCGR